MLKSFCLMRMPDLQMHDDLVMDHKITRPDGGSPAAPGDQKTIAPKDEMTTGIGPH